MDRTLHHRAVGWRGKKRGAFKLSCGVAAGGPAPPAPHLVARPRPAPCSQSFCERTRQALPARRHFIAGHSPPIRRPTPSSPSATVVALLGKYSLARGRVRSRLPGGIIPSADPPKEREEPLPHLSGFVKPHFFSVTCIRFQRKKGPLLFPMAATKV